MERKLIQQGGGGYTVYLPKRWLDKKGLGRGAKVQVIETETSLIVTSEVVQRLAITIAITPQSRGDLQNILTHLYRRGYESITFTGVGAVDMEQIRQVTQGLLLGFEVTEREADTCRIENLSEPAEQKYDLLLKRVFYIIKETHSIIDAELRSGRFTDEVAKLRQQQDKYLLFCRRALIRETEPRLISTSWELLTFLMHIEHAYYYLHKYAGEHNVKASAHIIDLLGETKEYLDLYCDAYNKKDMSAVHRINSRRDELIFSKCPNFMLEAKGHEVVLIAQFKELLRLIQVGTSPILSELLQAELVLH